MFSQFHNSKKILFPSLTEAGVYTVSAGGGQAPSSFYVFGKNISLIGSSTKDCILLYKTDTTSTSASKLETLLICAGPGDPTLIKRLTFRNANTGGVKTKFFGVGGGHVQIEVSKNIQKTYCNSKERRH